MRSAYVVSVIALLAIAAPRLADAQEPERPAATVTSAQGATATVTRKPTAELEAPARNWVRTLTNVQVELTITDQSGAGTPEKKTVSMVVSSGSWGRIRSAGGVRIEPGLPPIGVDLNVDARPLVSVEGPIQLELTIAYSPLGPSAGDGKGKPPTVNQSLTVILQNGKPLVISQAADPVGDRKIIVEAKATVLK